MFAPPARLLVVLGVLAYPAQGWAQDGAGVPEPRPIAQQSIELTPSQLFQFADAARDRGDFDLAEHAYRAMTTNPDMQLRNEARFRLALMLADLKGDHAGAAVLLRQILDEQPDTAPVRLQLARMQAMMGDLDAADRELRAAQAVGLPPDVERLVRFFRSSLANRSKPFGIDFEVSFAPDSNINRATRSDTLGTIIGDFDLSDDAQAQSGIGLATRASAYARFPIEDDKDLLVRLDGSGRFYEKSEFNDLIAGVQAGPAYRLGSDRIELAGLVNWRWFGGNHYTTTYGARGSLRHPLGKRTLLRLDGSLVYADDKLNDLRDAEQVSLAIGVDRAFNARAGGGLQLSSLREFARDPGYSTSSGGAGGYVYREFGQTTAVARLDYRHLEADKRLFLYPRRRVDDRIAASLSANFRALRIGRLAPLARLSYERTFSTVELFSFDRLAVELGLAAAF